MGADRDRHSSPGHAPWRTAGQLRPAHPLERGARGHAAAPGGVVVVGCSQRRIGWPCCRGGGPARRLDPSLRRRRRGNPVLRLDASPGSNEWTGCAGRMRRLRVRRRTGSPRGCAARDDGAGPGGGGAGDAGFLNATRPSAAPRWSLGIRCRRVRRPRKVPSWAATGRRWPTPRSAALHKGRAPSAPGRRGGTGRR